MQIKARHHANHWLPRLIRVNAITIGRNVYWNGPIHPRLLPHELAHVRQYDRLGLVRFLACYLWEYLLGRLKLMGHDAAYRNISFEREARRINPFETE